MNGKSSDKRPADASMNKVEEPNDRINTRYFFEWINPHNQLSNKENRDQNKKVLEKAEEFW